MIVALRPIAPRPGHERSQADHLTWLASLDPDCPHRLCDDPEEADAILVTDALAGREVATALRSDPWIERYWQKIYGFSQEARPFRALPGVYTSYPITGRDRDVSRAIGYPCWPLNPWIDQDATALPEREPDLLYSFLGRRSHPVRNKIFATAHPPDSHVVDTTRAYVNLVGPEEDRRDHERAYVDVALRSKFALCPRGWATSTVRLYEMMALGVAPVVLADAWARPHGPEWDRCAVFVRERDAKSLPAILRERESEWRDLGSGAFQTFRRYFSPERHFRTVISALADLVEEPTSGRDRLRRRWPLILPAMSARELARRLVRRLG